MANNMQHGADVSHNSPSPSIWNAFNQDNATYNNRLKVFWDDFDSFGITTAVTSNVGLYNSNGKQYVSYEDTGGAIGQLATNDLGVISIATDNSDNDECWLMPGGVASVFGTAKTKANGGLSLGFEARVSPTLITSGNWFIGMSEEGLAAADTITDSGAMASKDFIGFRVLEDDPDGLDIVYRKAGQSEVVLVSVAQTLVAATFYKLGFLIDMKEPDTNKRGKFFIDGVEQSTYITDAILAAATFPGSEELHMLAGVKNSTTAATTLSIDWVKMAQPRYYY